MFRIESKIDTSSPEFLRNKEDYLKVLDAYKKVLEKAKEGGSEQAVKRHKERGKLLARERIYHRSALHGPIHTGRAAYDL